MVDSMTLHTHYSCIAYITAAAACCCCVAAATASAAAVVVAVYYYKQILQEYNIVDAWKCTYRCDIVGILFLYFPINHS